MSDNYWITPEDVQQSWASLREVLEGHSDCQITLALIVKSGSISYVGEVEKRNLQPRNRNRVESSQNWWSVIRQLQAIGMNVRGTAVISIDILVDTGGNPILWTAPGVRGLKCL